MDERNKVLAGRVASYLLVLGVALGGVWVLINGAGETELLGIKGRTIYAIAGMALAIVVTMSFSKTMFSNLPPREYGKDDYDGLPNSRALGRIAEIKYSRRAGKGGGKFEDHYSVGRKGE